MPKIVWASLIADAAGNIDYVKVRQLASILLALLGGAAVVAGAVMELTGIEKPLGHMLLAASVLVVPLTGGKIADAFAAKK